MARDEDRERVLRERVSDGARAARYAQMRGIWCSARKMRWTRGPASVSCQTRLNGPKEEGYVTN